MRVLRTLLDDHPWAAALKAGRVASDRVALSFDPTRPAPKAFPRVVEGGAFDIAELSLPTFLQARGLGRPLQLLPVVALARVHHPYLVYDRSRGLLRPDQLAGKRVGIRLYGSGTGLWVRAILQEVHGIDPEQVAWTAFEAPHLAEVLDPPWVARAAAGQELFAMLFAGELDAVIANVIPSDPRLATVIPDAVRAAARWRADKGMVQVNHVMVASAALVAEAPEAVGEAYSLMLRSKAATVDEGMNPMGPEAVRPCLELAIAWAARQGLAANPPTVEALLAETARIIVE